ncbi:dimethylsulfonioproprionate lyase family protein [Marimonas lutisalis]|uniref:dimethylsulfonioproprionate lyase family protein n=1 Tax=Marimonas lutisalis TaxID=2545756 RepID=UPI0010F7CBD4|nr:dimethylsulfonioproprionate lyase family protein [Marimonas lutisalis]
MTPENALNTLMTETRALIATKRALMEFAGPLDGLSLTLPQPHDLPVTAGLDLLMPQTAPETAPLTFAVLAAAPHLEWQQSYSRAEVGAHYLDNYGWFNLVGPDGPFIAEDLRISFGVWGQGLTYPRHWHAPEEIYCVLAGGARFLADGRDPVEAGPGTLVHHPPNLPHSMEMHAAPLLAVAVWKGAGLTAKPGIDAPGG